MHKKLAISKQLQTHFKAKHEKGVGTPFPRVSAPLHPWQECQSWYISPRIYSLVLSCICVFFVTAMHV